MKQIRIGASRSQVEFDEESWEKRIKLSSSKTATAIIREKLLTSLEGCTSTVGFGLTNNILPNNLVRSPRLMPVEYDGYDKRLVGCIFCAWSKLDGSEHFAKALVDMTSTDIAPSDFTVIYVTHHHQRTQVDELLYYLDLITVDLYTAPQATDVALGSTCQHASRFSLVYYCTVVGFVEHPTLHTESGFSNDTFLRYVEQQAEETIAMSQSAT